MKTQQAIKQAGSIRKLATLLNITTTAIYAWKGEMPQLRSFQFKEWVNKQAGKAKK